MQKQEQKSTVAGVWSALATGFDLTAKHPWTLLLPIILDVFIWIGPRLRFQTILNEIVASFPAEAQLLELAEQLAAAGPQTNLFTVLSVPLLGVPVLMNGLVPAEVPLALPATEIGGPAEWLFIFLVLSLAGLFLTAVYYVTISDVIEKRFSANGRIDLQILLRQVGATWGRLAGLAILCFIAALIIYIPISIVGALFLIINSTLGMLVVVLAPLVLIWVLIYFSFAPPAIAVNDRSLFRSIKESLQLVQAGLPAVLSMLLLILLLGAIVDWLLILADNGTWLTLFNILIHAFVNTGFVTAFFIFYRDRARVLSETGHTTINKLV